MKHAKVRSAGDVVTPQTRRQFIKTTAAAASGLVIGFYLPLPFRFGGALAAAAGGGNYPPNAFVKIAPNNTITILIAKLEFGQGVSTSLPMLIAEELDCDWQKIQVEHAPVAPEYNHTKFGVQMTGGSTSVASSYDQLRTVGARARLMLIEAAAKHWQAPTSALTTSKGYVFHKASGRKLTYGALAEAANKLPLPEKVTLKESKNFSVIGKETKRLDSPAKVTGQEIFGLDYYLPNAATVVVARCPVFGGKVKNYDGSDAKKVRGVVDVVSTGTVVAVVAKNFWAAKKGRDALKVEWDQGSFSGTSTEQLQKTARDLAQTPGTIVKTIGDIKTLGKSAHVVEAVYEVPYLAHAPMEPLNCTVDFDGKSARIWAGTQFQTVDRDNAAAALGLKRSQVEVTTLMAGGGFGRRANPRSDYIVEACEIAKAVKKPIKVVWTREDDLSGGYYRPMFTHRVRASVSAKGQPEAWEHTIVGQSILAGTPFEVLMKDGIDFSSIEGVVNMSYPFPHALVSLHTVKSEVPVLWWRSVGHSHTAFVVETMIDELAAQAKRDPAEFRRALLKKHPRHTKTLELVLQKSGWGKRPAAKGSGRGLAIHESFGSVVAHVVDVTVKNGELKVTRVVSAVDCGLAVNPLTVRAQIEGAMVYGLSAALYGKISFKDGVVEQKNFSDYAVVRMNEMPPCEVHIVPSRAAPTGVGEPGTPPLAPALANAIFAATGKRIRALPIAGQLS